MRTTRNLVFAISGLKCEVGGRYFLGGKFAGLRHINFDWAVRILFPSTQTGTTLLSEILWNSGFEPCGYTTSWAVLIWLGL